MNTKYGLYIKGRGWIKTVRLDKGIICCRNFSDTYVDFRFDKTADIAGVEYRYDKFLSEAKYEVREASEDDAVDKRVIPSNKYNYAQSYYPKPLELDSTTPSYLRTYCTWCGLRILKDEESSGSVCIHCLVAFTKLIEKRYNKMDVSIKESWERAKILDEI